MEVGLAVKEVMSGYGPAFSAAAAGAEEEEEDAAAGVVPLVEGVLAGTTACLGAAAGALLDELFMIKTPTPAAQAMTITTRAQTPADEPFFSGIEAAGRP